MKRIHTYTLLGLLLLGFASCETIIEVDLPEHKPQLAVNSTFSPDSLWIVNLSSTVGIGDSEDPKIIENGTVLVSADGAPADTFAYFSDGFYIHPRALIGEGPVPGVNYEVVANAPGFPEARSTNRIPVPVEVNSASTRISNIAGGGDENSEITLSFDDPAGKNYYFLAVLVDDSLFGQDRFPINLESNNPALNATPLYSEYNFQGLLFSDLSFEGRTAEITAISFFYNLDSISTTLVLGTLSEDYFKYAQTYSSFFENQFNPFAEPVRIHNNVENGYGIFAGFSTDEYEL